MARLCVLSSPMDPDLLFSSMRVSDRLSRMYEIDIEAVSTRDDLAPKDILGKFHSNWPVAKGCIGHKPVKRAFQFPHIGGDARSEKINHIIADV